MIVQNGIGMLLYVMQNDFMQWLIAVWNDFDIRNRINFIAFIIFYMILKREKLGAVSNTLSNNIFTFYLPLPVKDLPLYQYINEHFTSGNGEISILIYRFIGSISMIAVSSYLS